MKKTIPTILVSIAVSMASAASFTWTTSALAFGSTEMKKVNVTAYLIYLGNDVDQKSSISVTKDSTAETIATSFGTSAKVAQSYDTQTGRTGLASDDFSFSASNGDYHSKDKFALLLSYTSDSKTYFNLSSVDSVYTLSIPASNPDIATYAAADYSFGNSIVGESSTLSSGGGWVQAVPEPSTAILGLLGLGMLLKRRKA